MAKRVKPVLNIPAVTTLEEADATLAQIAAGKRELALSGRNPRTGDLVSIPERNNIVFKPSKMLKEAINQ